MRRALPSLLLTAGCALAQITQIQPTDQVNASRAVINANFAYLDGKQLYGSGAPSVTCGATVNLGYVYVRTDAGVTGSSLYVCAKTGSSSYAWDGPYGSGGTSLGYTPLNPANNLSDVLSASAARTSLGLGSSATQPSTAFEPAITAGTTTKFWRGDKLWQTLDTSAVPENGSLYFTAARAQSAMAGLYQTPITTGTSSQYLKGDLTLGTFPTTWPWASLSGVPTALAYVDATSSIQTQLNGKASTSSIPTASSATPVMDGTAAVGVSTTYARADHVHPTDTSRQAAITTGTSDQVINGSLGLSALVNCTAAGGVYQYSTATHAFSCHALGSADIPSNAANTSGTAGGLAAAYVDWNAASGGSSILNKPTIPTVQHTITIPIAGSPIATGTGGVGLPSTPANFACTITKAEIIANASGSIAVDVWKANLAVPTSAGKISASAPVSLSSAQINASASLTGWTTSVISGDVFWASVASVDGSLTSASVQIWCQ